MNRRNHRLFVLILPMLSLTAFANAGQPVTSGVDGIPPADTEFAVTEVRVLSYADKETSSGFSHASLASTGSLVFEDHWDNSQLFAYKDISLKDLPETLEITLIDKLDDFHPPVIGKVYSKYGPRGRRNHNGVDIPLKLGDPVHAAFGGKVRYARYNSGGFGNMVIVRHANGLETWYAHLSKCNVKENDFVQAGDIIGLGGSTGRSRGPHLHFEMRYCDQTFDPEHLIDFPAGDLRYHTFVLDRTFFSIYSRATEKLEEDDEFEKTVLGDTTELTSADILNNLAEHEKAEQAKPKPSDPVYHTIRSGDYLGKIARQYGTTVTNLCKLNGIGANSTIRAGKRLRVR